jgi:hypothetical protein
MYDLFLFTQDLGDQDLTLLARAVTEKQIAKVVARATGIPADNLLQGEVSKLLDMEKVLNYSSISVSNFHLTITSRPSIKLSLGSRKLLQR